MLRQVGLLHSLEQKKSVLRQVGLVHSLVKENNCVLSSRYDEQPGTRKYMCYVKSVWCTASNKKICVTSSRSGAQPRKREQLCYVKSVWCKASNKKIYVTSSRSGAQPRKRQHNCVMLSRSGSIWRCTVRCGRIQVERQKNIISDKIIFRSSPPLPHCCVHRHDHNISSSREAELLQPTDEDCVFSRNTSTLVPVCTASHPDKLTIILLRTPCCDIWHDIWHNIPSCVYLCLGLTWRNWPFSSKLHYFGMSLILG